MKHWSDGMWVVLGWFLSQVSIALRELRQDRRRSR